MGYAFLHKLHRFQASPTPRGGRIMASRLYGMPKSFAYIYIRFLTMPGRCAGCGPGLALVSCCAMPINQQDTFDTVFIHIFYLPLGLPAWLLSMLYYVPTPSLPRQQVPWGLTKSLEVLYTSASFRFPLPQLIELVWAACRDLLIAIS